MITMANNMNSGKRIPKEEWDKLTPEEKKKILAARKAQGEKDGSGFMQDWLWYALNDRIAKDFGSLPYNLLSGVGFDLKMSPVKGTNIVAHGVEHSVMVLHTVIGPGVATRSTSGVNAAARQLYEFVRHANSGAKNYESADLMMYILAMADIYAQVAEIARAIGIVQFYPIENRSIPDTLLKSLGLDPADMRAHIASYRGTLNVLIKKINGLAVPKEFTIFDRVAYIYNKVFADSSSIRGQFYIFSRDYNRVWNPTGPAGTQLVAEKITRMLGPGKFRSLSQDLQDLESMVDAVFEDQDSATMGGDILKAFGNENLHFLNFIAEDYVVSPVMDENVLAQIENAVMPVSTYTGAGWNTDSLIINQQAGVISYEPMFDIGTVPSTADEIYGVMNDYLLNSHKDEPDYKDNLEWTRLMATFVTDDNQWAVTSCGTELVLGFTAYTTEQVNTSTFTTGALYGNIYWEAQSGAAANLSVRFQWIEQFDWHPIMYYMIRGGTQTSPTFTLYPGGDLKKYTVISSENLKNLNECANTAVLWSRNFKVAKAEE